MLKTVALLLTTYFPGVLWGSKETVSERGGSSYLPSPGACWAPFLNDSV